MRVFRFSVIGSCLLGQIPAHAQVAPDAGSVRQQLEVFEDRSTEPRPDPDPMIIGADVSKAQGTAVLVRSFRFEGNSLLSALEISEIVSQSEGRMLGFDDLQRLAGQISARYRKRGRLARVYLPEQDITSGDIVFRIVEASFGDVRFQGSPPRLVRLDTIEAFIRRGQAGGAPLDNHSLERGLLLADDLAGVSIGSTLAPGSGAGTTDVVVRSADEPAVYGNVAFDNLGSRLIGAHRLSASLIANSPSRIGDQLRLDLLRAEGTRYIRGVWRLPLGHAGLGLSLSGSYLDYAVSRGSAFAGKATGRSGNTAFELRHSVVRLAQSDFNVRIAIARSTFETRFAEYVSNYASVQLSAGVDGFWYDNVLSRAVTSFSAKVSVIGLDRARLDPFYGQIGRRFGKVEFSMSRTQAVGLRTFILLNVSGQYARSSLDTSEKLFVGGASSVRAYPASELGGDRGIFTSLELRREVRPGLLISGFLDHGRVTTLATTFDPSTRTRPISGFGVGASWQGPRGLSASLTWARRIGGNPGATPAGSDSDGTLIRNRIWFSAQFSF